MNECMNESTAYADADAEADADADADADAERLNEYWMNTGCMNECMNE